MTTRSSPITALKAQAEKIATMLKIAQRGGRVDATFAEKISAARRDKDHIKFGVVMDDKIITVEMPWTVIDATEERALAKYILDLMQEAAA